jgi:hypothetical protein
MQTSESFRADQRVDEINEQQHGSDACDEVVHSYSSQISFQLPAPSFQLPATASSSRLPASSVAISSLIGFRRVAGSWQLVAGSCFLQPVAGLHEEPTRDQKTRANRQVKDVKQHVMLRRVAAKLRLKPPRVGKERLRIAAFTFITAPLRGARNLQGAVKTCFIYCESRPLEISRPARDQRSCPTCIQWPHCTKSVLRKS